MFNFNNSKELFKKYENILDYIGIFEHDDLMQEYEVFKLENEISDKSGFDWFFKNCLKKAQTRYDIKDEIEDEYIYKEQHEPLTQYERMCYAKARANGQTI